MRVVPGRVLVVDGFTSEVVVSKDSKIEWTDHTFNPWWGCVKVSAACKHCYAEAFSKRLGLPVWGADAPRRFFGDKHWNEPLKWNRDAEKEGVRKRVFCASMADVFEELGAHHPQRNDMVEARLRLWAIITDTPWLDWLLLTKRPQNVMGMVPLDWFGSGDRPAAMGDGPAMVRSFPHNVWVGTTVEDQAAADERIPHLLRVPSRVRFLSCEPMMEIITLPPDFLALGQRAWVICGGESGHGSRPMQPNWARVLRDQCAQAGVPFLFKQWGDIDATGHNVGKKVAGRELDGVVHDGYPDTIKRLIDESSVGRGLAALKTPEGQRALARGRLP